MFKVSKLFNTMAFCLSLQALLACVNNGRKNNAPELAKLSVKCRLFMSYTSGHCAQFFVYSLFTKRQCLHLVPLLITQFCLSIPEWSKTGVVMIQACIHCFSLKINYLQLKMHCRVDAFKFKSHQFTLNSKVLQTLLHVFALWCQQMHFVYGQN